MPAIQHLPTRGERCVVRPLLCRQGAKALPFNTEGNGVTRFTLAQPDGTLPPQRRLKRRRCRSQLLWVVSIAHKQPEHVQVVLSLCLR